MIRSLQAPVTEVVAGVIYQFAGWSDGVATAARSLVFPSTDTNILAAYQPIGIVPYVTVNNASESVRRGIVQKHQPGFQRTARRRFREKQGRLLAGSPWPRSGLRHARRSSCSLSHRGLPRGSQHREAGAFGSTDHAPGLRGGRGGFRLKGDGPRHLRPPDRRQPRRPTGWRFCDDVRTGSNGREIRGQKTRDGPAIRSSELAQVTADRPAAKAFQPPVC